MEEGTDIMNLNGILDIYKDYCVSTGFAFKEEDYKEFIKYLEIDLFDWVKENIRQFQLNKL